MSFNPVLGFLPSATVANSASGATTTSFNPVLGFLPSATLLVWIHTTSTASGFNPVLGFLPSATLPYQQRFLDYGEFQSRAGFSAFCDGTDEYRDATETRFNPVLGFLPSATLGL